MAYLKKSVIVNEINNRPFILQEANKQNKKYMAIFPISYLSNDPIPLSSQPQKMKTVYFGDRRYQHYEDQTPLKLFSHLNHKDKQRKKLYYDRFGVYAEPFSAKWFSHRYLW